MAAYGYTRVSTGKQAQLGQSLEVQQRIIQGYAMMQGLELTQLYVETGISGSIPIGDRPQGKALLAALQPGDVIITPKLDRMFRSAIDALSVLADLKKRGISLHMIDLGGDVTGNGISKLVFTILSAVAEAERERIQERVVTTKADQRERGCYLGGHVPFGFEVVDGQLVPNPEQQAIIRRILEAHAHGWTLRRIRDTLQLELSINTINNVIQRSGSIGQTSAAQNSESS